MGAGVLGFGFWSEEFFGEFLGEERFLLGVKGMRSFSSFMLGTFMWVYAKGWLLLPRVDM